MKLENTDQSLLKRLNDSSKMVICAKLIPYKNNTCIKAYTEDGEPLGDIPEDEIQNYINKPSEILFVKSEFDDDTGLFSYIVETLM